MGLLERLKSKFRFPSLHHHGCHTCGPKCGGETHVYKGGVEHYDGKVIIEEDGAPSTPERVQPPATEDLPPQPDTPEAAEEENPYLKAAEKIQLPLLRVIK